MAYHGLNGFNTRVLGGISRDNVLAAQANAQGAVLLAMDDPELSRAAHAQGAITIYRQTGDAPENGPLDHTAADFMTERLKNGVGSDYIGFYNELDPSPLVIQRTIECMEICYQASLKGVILNLATNKSKAQWEMCIPAIQRADELKFGVGVHFYPDNVNDEGGKAFLDVKHAFPNLFWVFTEFNYLRNINNATQGWRGTNLDRKAFIQKWTQFFVQENMPACWFPYDFWDQPNVQEAKANGLGYNDLPDVLGSFSALNKVFLFKGIPPMTQPVLPPDIAPVDATVSAVYAGVVNIRPQPNTTQAPTATIKAGSVIRYRQQKVVGASYKRGTNESFNTWYYADSPVGWFASELVTLQTQESWTKNLAVPYVSQIDANSGASNNDCGVASLLMLIRFWFNNNTHHIPSLPTVNDLESKTVLAQPNPPKGLSFDQVQALALQQGFDTKYLSGLTPVIICQYIDAGRPVFALVDYARFYPAAGEEFAHFAVVKGYSSSYFNCADPYKGGSDFKVLKTQLAAAMKDVIGNSIDNQGLVLGA